MITYVLTLRVEETDDKGEVIAATSLAERRVKVTEEFHVYAENAQQILQQTLEQQFEKMKNKFK